MLLYQSDLYDVLAYIAFALPPLTRAERVESHRAQILADHDYPQQEFLRFVLGHYIERGVGELDTGIHSVGVVIPETGHQLEWCG